MGHSRRHDASIGGEHNEFGNSATGIFAVLLILVGATVDVGRNVNLFEVK